MVKIANYISTTLAENVAASDLSFDVASASGMPSIGVGDWFYLVLVRNSDGAKEIIKVTGVSTNTLTVTRAQEGTTALALVTGDLVQLWVTAGTLTDLVAVPSVAFTVSSGSLVKTVDVQVTPAGYFIIRAWLVDGSTPTDQQTLTPPDGSDVVQWEKMTDAAGLAVFTIQHTGSSKTWYLCASAGGQVQISDAITLGT